MVRGPESPHPVNPAIKPQRLMSTAAILGAGGPAPSEAPSVAGTTESDALSQTPELVEVRAGDTLGSLAARYHVSLAQLKELNPHLFEAGRDAAGRRRAQDGHWIYPGEQVRLRPEGAASTPEAVAAKARAAAKAAQPTPVKTAPVAKATSPAPVKAAPVAKATPPAPVEPASAPKAILPAPVEAAPVAAKPALAIEAKTALAGGPTHQAQEAPPVRNGVTPPPRHDKGNPSKVFAVERYTPRYGQTSVPAPSSSVAGSPDLGKNGALIVGGLMAAMALVKLPASVEKDIGDSAVKQALMEEPLYTRNPQVVNYVAEVGKRLVRQNDRTDLDWNFYVVDSPQVNAFSLPGGHIFITTAALRAMRSEDELAGVLAHEIAHVEQRHSMKKLQTAMAAQGLATAALGNQSEMARLGGQLAVQIGMNGYDQGQEDEADKRGVELAYQAGYDAHGLTRFFETLRTKSPDKPEWLAWTSDHPRTIDRINKVNRQLETTGMGNAAGVNPDRFSRYLRGL